MTRPRRVQVFVDDAGRHGNPLTVIPDAGEIDEHDALAIARQAATSETVFVDDPAVGLVRIYVPRRRVPFAGHPLVGVGGFFWASGHEVTALRTDAGEVPVRVTSDRGTFDVTVVAPVGRGVPWELVQLPTVAAVEAADSSGADRHDYVWAWEDEARGQVRTRAFTSVSGTEEDEATGSAAVELCAALGRSLQVRQGRGSLIRVTPDGGAVALSGTVLVL